MHAAVRYHRLVAPLAEIAFHEDGERASWSMAPVSHPRVDARMYRFLVELQTGTHWSLMRDVMGQSFAPREVAVTFSPPGDVEAYQAAFGDPYIPTARITGSSSTWHGWTASPSMATRSLTRRS